MIRTFRKITCASKSKVVVQENQSVSKSSSTIFQEQREVNCAQSKMENNNLITEHGILVEAQFGASPGVIRTRVGFAGGSLKNPTYRHLGDHTETVDIEYDPNIVTYEELLSMFWKNHDPSSKCSRQYMSAIFYHNATQKDLAEKSLQIEQQKKPRPIQTKILPLGIFTDAEDYHQKYLLQKYPAILNTLDIEPGEELNKSFVATKLNGYVGGYGTLKNFEQDLKQLGLPIKVETSIRNMITSNKKSNVAC